MPVKSIYNLQKISEKYIYHVFINFKSKVLIIVPASLNVPF